MLVVPVFRAEITVKASKLSIKCSNTRNFKGIDFLNVGLMNVSDGSADHFYFSSRHIKKMFSLEGDTDSYFLCSPSTHCNAMLLTPSRLFSCSLKFLGLLSSKVLVFWEVLGYSVYCCECCTPARKVLSMDL